jgi:hypothetical protein
MSGITQEEWEVLIGDKAKSNKIPKIERELLEDKLRAIIRDVLNFTLEEGIEKDTKDGKKAMFRIPMQSTWLAFYIEREGFPKLRKRVDILRAILEGKDKASNDYFGYVTYGDLAQYGDPCHDKTVKTRLWFNKVPDDKKMYYVAQNLRDYSRYGEQKKKATLIRLFNRYYSTAPKT